jgi:UDP-3-O-[3-hydroxymyristoyl] glucosamine N-acyltransferase
LTVSNRSLSVASLAKLLADFQPQTQGDATIILDRVATLLDAGPSALTFLSNGKYRNQAQNTQAGCLLLSTSEAALLPVISDTTARIICANPYAAFAIAAQWFAACSLPAAQVHPSAVVSTQATIGTNASIGPHAVIEAGAVIEEGAIVGAGCFIGSNAHIGLGSVLNARVTVYADCEIGRRCIIHSGAVIGADGFGFASHKGRWIKIPQTGRVLIGDDCEVGANTTIDRGALSDTLIGNGVKLDNQVQIGHNVVVGDDCAFAGCVGVAGSAIIGQRVQLGGGAIVLGHLQVCNDVVISAATTVTRSIIKPGFYSGVFPLDENAKWEKSAVLVRNLDKMRAEVKALRKELDILKQQI